MVIRGRSIQFSRLALLLAGLVTPLLLAGAASAAQSITITPTSVDETLTPGTTTSGKIQVINTGSDALDFKVYATPYNVTGEDYKQHFTALPGKPDIVSWFKLPSTASHINPKQTADIAYSISPPANTPPGGYYATIFAETTPPVGQSANGVILRQRVGTIFYLQVGGTAKKSGSLDGWQAKFWQIQPLVGSLKVKNDGDVHFLAETNLVVRDIFGNPKFTLTTAREVLPRTIRQVDATWSKAPPLGLFKVSGSVRLLGHTHTLPTKYVLVASWPVRWLFVAIVVAVVVFVALWHRRGVRHAKD